VQARQQQHNGSKMDVDYSDYSELDDSSEYEPENSPAPKAKVMGSGWAVMQHDLRVLHPNSGLQMLRDT
jgi:hypothetical protein